MSQRLKLTLNDLCEVHPTSTLYVAQYVFQSQPSLPYNCTHTHTHTYTIG